MAGSYGNFGWRNGARVLGGVSWTRLSCRTRGRTSGTGDPPEDVRNGKALNGEHVILVQASDSRLGMYVMGQALFSRHLMEEWFRSRELEPKSLRSVIVCTDGDSDLEPFLKRYHLELFGAKSRSKPRG